jgi:hypothetical protein
MVEVKDEPLTEDELAQVERDVDEAFSSHYTLLSTDVLRLIAEVRRLRALATCEACAAGLRLGAPGMGPDGSGPGVMHYHGEDRGGATWGVCRRVVAAGERTELLRLRDQIASTAKV